MGSNTRAARKSNCDHEWSEWVTMADGTKIRYCRKCDASQEQTP